MRYISVWLGLIILTAGIAVACATPEPITEEVEVTVEVTRIVPQTVVVEAEKPVEVTRIVEQEVEVTRLVTQEVQVTVIVTPTAPPATATPRPTPTPTAPPATATPRPTPTPLPSAWKSFESESDAITGTKRSGVRTSGRMVGSDPHASLYSDPSLILRCSGKSFDAYATWGGRFLAANVRTDRIQTMYKIDDRNPVSTFSDESVDNEASFLDSPSLFASNLLDGDQVVIRVTSYDDTTMTAGFPITGLRHEKEKLGCW